MITLYHLSSFCTRGYHLSNNFPTEFSTSRDEKKHIQIETKNYNAFSLLTLSK